MDPIAKVDITKTNKPDNMNFLEMILKPAKSLNFTLTIEEEKVIIGVANAIHRLTIPTSVGPTYIPKSIIVKYCTGVPIRRPT